MPIYIYAILGSFIASLVAMTVKENRRVPLVFFPFFLLVSSGVEWYGSILSARNAKTALLYNLFSTVEFLFYLFFFACLFTTATIRKLMALIMVGYLGIALVNIIKFQGRTGFHSYTYVLGCILIVVSSVAYFNFLFQLPETTKLTRNPYFWIVAGLMFFHTCAFPLVGLENYVIENMGMYNGLLFFILDFLNILLYTLFITGFLCRVNFRNLLRL